jgi:hypothetical protein
MLRISEINTKMEFFEMKNRWDQTLNKSVEDNVFLTWEKMAPSVNYLGSHSSLKILCATEGDELVGIAPFRVTRKGLIWPLGYGILEPLTNGDTDYNGIIVTQNEDQCVHEFLTYLFSQKDWDFMYFPDLPQSSPSLALIENSSGIQKLEILKGIVCPFVTVPDTKDKFLASLNSKFQKKLKKSLQKLEAEQGKVELKQYRELGSLEQAMEIFFNLHQMRWVSKGEPGRFKMEKSRDITFQTAKYFAEKDWLRLYFLTVDKKPVAVELNLEYKGTMYCHLKGFNPNFSRYRVGSLLTLKVLEDCVSKGVVEYDFMQGAEPYKFDWTEKFRTNMNIKLVNKKTSSNLIDVGLKVLIKSKIYFILIKYVLVLSSFSNSVKKI